MPAYSDGQILGGVLAVLTVWATQEPAALDRASLGSPALVDNTNSAQGIMIKTLIAFILVFVITGVATDKRVPLGSAGYRPGRDRICASGWRPDRWTSHWRSRQPGSRL